ncbi:RimK family alpha-L-glutamate ligase [Thermoflexus sp.]|uniref:ATP-grasp domain-containing protein n=1 Tax=Thermoflexus sp. TaxID=1969742 RepID=UPI0035E4031E
MRIESKVHGEIVDLAIAWNWDCDRPFVEMLREACGRRGLSMASITPEDLPEILERAWKGEWICRAFFDRASDWDEDFEALVDWARAAGVFRLNPTEQARAAWDKAAMHRRFIAAGLPTPPTWILPPWNEQPEVEWPEKAIGLWIAKPAFGGGGEGVKRIARPEDLTVLRTAFPDEPFLIQRYVRPRELEGRPAWFRVIYAVDAVFPCWWNPETHRYAPVTEAEREAFGLSPLWAIGHRIAEICGLHLFSSEIAMDEEGRFLCIDYVNDPIDTRPQSMVPEGVPDEILHRIADRIAEGVFRRAPCRSSW